MVFVVAFPVIQPPLFCFLVMLLTILLVVFPFLPLVFWGTVIVTQNLCLAYLGAPCRTVFESPTLVGFTALLTLFSHLLKPHILEFVA